MAKKPARGVKTQAIQDYLTVNKKAKAAEVVTALAKLGINVTPSAVYNLKARKTMGKRRRKARAGGQTVGLSITGLLAAKKLVDAVGGFDQARAAVDALGEVGMKEFTHDQQA